MDITEEALKAIMPNIERNLKANKHFTGYSVQKIADVMNELAPAYGIITKLRWVHFLANIALESGEFRRTEENLNYSYRGLISVFPRHFKPVSVAEKYVRKPEAIANRVYANRIGNGDEASGDGWKFRGRGLMQITGRANYQKFKDDTGIDVITHPELLATPKYALMSAMKFFSDNGLNAYADTDNGLYIRKRINGGTHGWHEVMQYIAKGKNNI